MTLAGNRAPLDSLLQPASVAVVGARDDISTFGGRVWTYLTRDYRGLTTAVNAVRADPVFGRLLLIGAGGPGVEELADVAIGREPLEPGRIRDLIASTRAGRWLASPASRALFDIGSLTHVAEQALHAFTRSAGLESLDLNPVVVTAAGATIVDAKASGRRPRPATEVPA